MLLSELGMVNEVHPDTVAGAFSASMDTQRQFLINKLKEVRTDYSVIYILGSWYGNLSLLLAAGPDITYRKIINVELDPETLRFGNLVAKKWGATGITGMHKDANQLDYRQLDRNGLVVNQSTTNIEGSDWFDNIPSGTTVALTGRNRDPGAVNQFSSLEQFVETYSLQDILYAGQKKLVDPETEFSYYCLIGNK